MTEDLTSTADLPAIRARHFLRVLVSYSRTNFFLDESNHQRGLEYELMKQYETFLNKNVKGKQIRVSVVFVPLPFNQLIPALLAGRGDIIAANLTVTDQRKKQVAFTNPYIADVSEVVVSHRSAPPLSNPHDLSGRKLHVLRGSSYEQSLRAFNTRLEAAGRPPVVIQQADEVLATEDILELVNAGILETTVADSHLAAIWRNVLPNIAVHDRISLRSGGKIAWAVRRDNRKLLQSLNSFIKQVRQGTKLGNVLFKRYYKNTQWIRSPLGDEDRSRLGAVRALFQKYGDKYDFDWLMITAQAYQESGLDHSKRSPAGAIGIMQLLKTTAADPNVGIPNIEVLENNIHAGVKYLHVLRTGYFADTDLDEAERINFCFAAYNAGPARIAQTRKKASARGLDPNSWFHNVELVARETLGTETVRYVRNIHKYYIAYKLLAEQRRMKIDARAEMWK